MAIEVYSPAPAEIVGLWPHVAPLVARGLDRGSHGEYTLEDVHAALLHGKLQLWMAKGGKTPAIGVTQIVQYPQFGTVLVIFCVGDGVEDWEDVGLTAIEEWAAKHRLRAVEVIGREGWTRRLGLLGYRKDAVMLRKELET